MTTYKDIVEGLSEAVHSVSGWGAYTASYFHEKPGLLYATKELEMVLTNTPVGEVVTPEGRQPIETVSDTMNRYHVATSQFLGQELPCVMDSDNNIVAAGCTSEDATLFAAAPELLEALELAYDLATNGLIDFSRYGFTCDADIEKRYAQAIAKAKGGEVKP